MDDSPPPPEASPPPPPPVTSGSPTDFLKNVVGKRVVVRLTSGVDYRGTFLFSPLCFFFFCLDEPGDGRTAYTLIDKGCCLALTDT